MTRRTNGGRESSLGAPVDLMQLGAAVLVARERREELKRKLKVATEAFETTQTRLALALRECGAESVEYGGFVLSASHKIRWRPLDDQRDDVVSILRGHVPRLVVETVNSMSLSAYLRKNEEELEARGLDWWQALKLRLERIESESLSIRRARKKRL